ncbi:hypothetical protein GH5_05284 [Leishmania sp. Ghana 2012 LV757]|uniref:hypothetical protein n=1 Tax=Leishmania sp. Ghana 2012 LV757 TaxID=2803181 RepID=UPI001B70E4DA|nr:hypothetical protein GH5_05284 [Leishmania sp. Ghana 2012 LV757]
MAGPLIVEAVSKALRRRAQLQRWQRESKTSRTSGATTTLASPDSNQVGRAMFQQCPSTPTSSPATTTSSSSPLVSSPDSRGLHVGRTLQRAYQLRDTAQASPPLQRRLAEYLRRSTGKAEAAEAFSLFARTRPEALTPAAIAEFTSAMLRHNVAAQMGVQAYEAALADAVGVAGESPWGDIKPAEARAFALYQARRLERYAVKGASFQAELGLTLEGADNFIVALTEHQLRKSAASSCALPVSCDALVELLHLDISWTSALQVYRYAKELIRVDPPADMTTRLMGLMTGYRTNALGSRPWEMALKLYDGLLKSGYDVPLDAHTSALDAVWRSGESFVKPHHALSPADRDCMWNALVLIRERVSDAQVTGDAGCRFTEALIKAAAAAGRWEAAVQILSDMDVTLAAASYRLLVPTPEAFLFAMASCNAAHNAAHASALYETFSALYTLRSAHPEALLAYVQSLRHVVHLSAQIGSQVEALVMDGKGLDRPCCVACLQLLSCQRVRTNQAEKWRVAQQLLRMYDSNPWPQQAQARKAELQTVFRCCHLIAAAAVRGTRRSSASAEPCLLITELRAYLISVFGRDSPECRWLDDTEVYSLLTTDRWESALEIYQRQVTQRPLARVADLPIPLRQVRHMFAQALLRCSRAATEMAGERDAFLLDEEGEAQERAKTVDFLAFAVRTVREVCADTGDAASRGIVAELLLHQALHAPRARERQQLALDAMRELSCGLASAVTPRLIDLVAQALSLTEEHVHSVLVEGSAQLRGKALERDGHRRIRASGCLDKMFT